MSLPVYWKNLIAALEAYCAEHALGDDGIERQIDERYATEIGYRERAARATSPERKALYENRALAAHEEWSELSSRLNALADKMKFAAQPNLPE